MLIIFKEEIINGKKDQEFVKDITNMDEDFPQWYTDVITKTDLVDYSPVKGFMVIKPYGYAIWGKYPGIFG